MLQMKLIVALAAALNTVACAASLHPDKIRRVENRLRILGEHLDSRLDRMQEIPPLPEDAKFTSESLLTESTPKDPNERLARIEAELERLRWVAFVTSTVTMDCAELGIRLPKTEKESPVGVDSAIVIILKSGQFMFKGEVVSKKRLSEIFSELVSKTPGVSLILQADKDTPHRLVVKVMDMARQAGIVKFAIATQKE